MCCAGLGWVELCWVGLNCLLVLTCSCLPSFGVAPLLVHIGGCISTSLRSMSKFESRAQRAQLRQTFHISFLSRRFTLKIESRPRIQGAWCRGIGDDNLLSRPPRKCARHVSRPHLCRTITRLLRSPFDNVLFTHSCHRSCGNLAP